jgi:hypothetical protein
MPHSESRPIVLAALLVGVGLVAQACSSTPSTVTASSSDGGSGEEAGSDAGAPRPAPVFLDPSQYEGLL